LPKRRLLVVTQIAAEPHRNAAHFARRSRSPRHAREPGFADRIVHPKRANPSRMPKRRVGAVSGGVIATPRVGTAPVNGSGHRSEGSGVVSHADDRGHRFEHASDHASNLRGRIRHAVDQSRGGFVVGVHVMIDVTPLRPDRRPLATRCRTSRGPGYFVLDEMEGL